MNETIKLSSYGEYSSSNYGTNAMYVTIDTERGRIELYFSYQTLVAFSAPGLGLNISQNYWGTTTGKHLNWISRDKSIRLNSEEFENKVKELTNIMNVNVGIC